MSDVIRIKRGAPWRRQWCVASESNVPINLTGSTMIVTLREKAGADEVAATVEITDAENGIFASSLTEEQVDALPRVMHLKVIQEDSLGTPAVRENRSVWVED